MIFLFRSYRFNLLFSQNHIYKNDDKKCELEHLPLTNDSKEDNDTSKVHTMHQIQKTIVTIEQD